MIERKREYVRECIRLLYTYMCMRERGREREREKRKLIIFRDNGSNVMIYDVEELIRIGAFSWPTAISHRRKKRKKYS